MLRSNSSGIELASKQIHEHAVTPCPVRGAPVLAHDSDLAEADLLVCPDRDGVVGGRVDGEAMVSTFMNQVARDRPNRVGSQSAALDVFGQKNVDPRVAEFGGVLLVKLDLPH